MNDSTVSTKNGLQISVDWLSFTVTVPMSPQEVISLIGFAPDQFTAMSKGGMGYKSMLKLDGYPVMVLYDGREDMGVHVSVSGSAIGELINSYRQSRSEATPFDSKAYPVKNFNQSVLADLLRSIRQVGHINRIDLAVDDIGAKYFSMGFLSGLIAVEHPEDRRCVSLFRSYQEMKTSDDKKVTGHTIYCGSRQSELMLRLYDKQAEQNKKLKHAGKPLIKEAWTRWELEAKDERANKIAEHIISGIPLGYVALGILNYYIRFIKNDATRKTNCSTLEKWEEFINAVGRLSLSVPKVEKTLDDKTNWFIRQVGPTFAGLIIASGGGMDFISNHFDDFTRRMSRDMIDIVSKANPRWFKEVDLY